MGGAWSLPRTQRILIGDLSTLPATEQRLYQLSQYVLNQKDPYIGTVSTELGFKIIDIDAKKALECVSAKETSDNAHLKSEITESREVLCNNDADSESEITDSREVLCNSDADSESERRDSRDVSCRGINIETEDGSTSLFHLLVTNKPYYFSQTFSQWKTLYRYGILCPLPCCRRDKRVIYLQPIDNFPDFITEFEEVMKSYGTSFDFFSLLKTFTEIFFDGMMVNLLPEFSIMQSKWKITTRLHHKTGQKQYFVRDFYNSLQRVTPPDGYCIMGMSWTDLYPTEDLNFVLGEASFATKSGIFCFGRYEPKTYDPETHKDITELDGKIFWRILKV